MDPFAHQRWFVFYVSLSLFAVASSVANASDDALLANAKVLEERQLIEAVLTRNPTLPALQAASDAALARVGHVSSLQDPRLMYTLAPRTVNTGDVDTGQNLMLSQQLPWPGKLKKHGERAEHLAKAAGEDITTARQKLIAQTRAVFAQWFYIHQALRINRESQALWQDFKQIAETKYATGRASKQDALRADVGLHMLRHRDIVLKRKRSDSLTTLNVLLHRQPDLSLPPPAELPDPTDLPSVVTLRAKALADRAELTALAARLRAKKAGAELAELNFYPDFNLTAGYNTLWDREEKRFSVGLAINLPLGQRKRRAALDETRAAALRVEWQLQEQRAGIAGEVQRAYDAVTEARHVLALYRDKLLPLAEETLSAARADYEAGGGDFLDLASAEKNLFDTQLNTAQSLADYHRNLAALFYSIGGSDPLFGEKQETNP